jgi:serine/threonine-protein kinase HipA
MRRAEVYQTAALAGYLTETEAKEFRFEYVAGYKGRPVSLTMPVGTETYEVDKFPPFFEGLRPEGRQLFPQKNNAMRCYGAQAKCLFKVFSSS